jgi:aspartate carbamoyltransferase regulatory subunit
MKVIKNVLRIVHDREKLHVYEVARGHPIRHIEAQRAWSYRQILKLVKAYESTNDTGAE